MIARIAWRLQEPLRRHRAFVALVLGVGALPGLLLLPRECYFTVVMALAALALQIHSLALQAVCAACLLTAIGLVILGGGDDLRPVLTALALVLPPAAELVRVPAAQVRLGAARACAWLGLSTQLALIALWPDHGALLGVLVATLGSALVLPALAWRRDDHERDDHPQAPQSSRGAAMLAAAILTAAAWATTPGSEVHAPDSTWPLISSGLVLAVWAGATQRWWPVIAVALGLALAAAWGRPTNAAGLALPQLLPLMVYLGRDVLGGPAPATVLISAVLLTAGGFVHPTWAPGLLAAAVTTWLLGWNGVRRPSVPGFAAMQQAVRAWPAGWCWFGRGKLNRDPLYRRLFEQSRAWGATLDLGCGAGLAAAVILRQDALATITGIDLDREKLLLARALAEHLGVSERLRLVQGMAPLEPTPSDRYTTILLFDVLHYWPPAEQRNLLNQAAHLLTDHGEIWVRDGADPRMAAGEHFTMAIGLNPSTRLELPDICGLAAICGLRVLSAEDCGTGNRLWRLGPGLKSPERPTTSQ